MSSVPSPRLRRLAIGGITALILAAPAAATHAHEFGPGADHGGMVITTTMPFPSGGWIVPLIGDQLGDDHGLHVELGDDHGRDGYASHGDANGALGSSGRP